MDVQIVYLLITVGIPAGVSGDFRNVVSVYVRGRVEGVGDAFTATGICHIRDKVAVPQRGLAYHAWKPRVMEKIADRIHAGQGRLQQIVVAHGVAQDDPLGCVVGHPEFWRRPRHACKVGVTGERVGRLLKGNS